MSLARYAGETPFQRSEHRRIAKRHRLLQKEKREPSALIINLFKVAMEELFAARYGERRLPDDDAGRDDLRIMMDVLMQRGEDHCRGWAAYWMPDLPDHELDDILDSAGKRWTPAAIGKALNLTNAERTRLGIRIILPVDRTKTQLKQDTKKRNAERERARRLEAGARPRKQSLSQTKPWVELGMSRRTYERKGLNDAVDANSCVILLSSLCNTKLRQGGPARPQGAPLGPVLNPWYVARPLNDSIFTEPREPKFIVLTASMANIPNGQYDVARHRINQPLNAS